MHTYINDIEAAVVIFPLIAALLTMPYLIRQYRKYGSVPLFLSLLVYLFVFYILTCYFLVLLPLPSDHTAVVKYAAHPQLVPFNWVPEVIEKTSFSIFHPSTWIKAICYPAFYEQIFNILMLVPFGMYLRYCFRLRWWQCLFAGFCLSFSFEVLQITGIFGWYEHPYRLFDVDDLITNSLGELVGCLVMAPAAKYLPDLRLIAEEARDVGVRASALQRLVSLVADITIAFVLCAVLEVGMLYGLDWLQINASEDAISGMMFAVIILSDLMVFAVVPALPRRQTPGQMLCKLVVVRPDGQRAHWYQPAARYGLLQIFAVLPFVWPVLFGLFGNAGAEAVAASTASAASVAVSDSISPEDMADLAFFAFWVFVSLLLVIQFMVRAIVAGVKKKPLVMLNGLLTNTRVMTLEGARIEQERHQVMSVPDVIALEKRIAEEGTSLATLMERAGEAAANEVEARVPDPKLVVIFAGSGNNGGDGWVVARVLARKGYEVTLITPAPAEDVKAQPAKDAALLTMRIMQDEQLPVTVLIRPEHDAIEAALGECAAVVDAMLGTGFAGQTVREPYQTWIRLANERRFGQRKAQRLSEAKRRMPHKTHRAPFALAVDTPSGLNAQTGAVAQPCFAADVTITMLAYKPGLIMDEAVSYTGIVKMNRLGV